MVENCQRPRKLIVSDISFGVGFDARESREGGCDSHFSELSFLTNPEIFFLLSFFHGHKIILSSISSAGEVCFI